MKTVWKLVGQESYDLDGLGAWLEEQAAAGLWLSDFTLGYARFDRRPPGRARYRLEPAEDAEEVPDREALEAYLESGWQYVCAYGKVAHVYRAARPDAPELHTDPVAESWALEPVRQRALEQLQLGIFLTVIFLFTAVGIPLLSPRPYTNLAQSDRVLFHLILLVFCAFYITHSALRYRQVRRRQKGLATGLPPERKARGVRLAAAVVVLSAVLYLLSQWAFLDPGVVPEYRELSSYQGPLPVADEAALKAASQPGADGGVSTRSYPLIPVDLIVYLNNGCSVEYRRLAWDWLAEGYARERAEIRQLDPEAAFSTEAFPTVYCGYGRDGFQYLVALRDRTVVEVRYAGDGDLSEGVEAVAAAVDAYEEAVE